MKAAEDKVALESQIQELKAMLKAEKVARGWLDKYTNDLVNRFLDLKSQVDSDFLLGYKCALAKIQSNVSNDICEELMSKTISFVGWGRLELGIEY